jgi:DNA-binding NarL/FixJ family response regulator
MVRERGLATATRGASWQYGRAARARADVRTRERRDMARAAELGPSGVLDVAPILDGSDSGTAVVLAAVWSALSLSVAVLLLHDPAAAHQVLAPLARLVQQAGMPADVTAMVLADEIEALLALGQVDRATSLVAALARRRRRDRIGDVLELRSRALLLAASGQLRDAEQTALQAVRRGKDVEPLEMARTCLIAGRIARRCKHRRRARQLMEQAISLFEELGCDPMVDRARLETARLDGQHEGLLTATEEQVADLSASGQTNRNVAAQLGISPKTVEANLTRIYRKLGIHSRAELGARLAGVRTEGG